MKELEYKEQIYKKADDVKTEADLVKLLRDITQFHHDYGTIVYGSMAAMKAAFNVVNNGPQGGITGFQAGCLGWECVHEFMMIKPPCKIVDYSNMLYPQYAAKFNRTISKSVWGHLQKEAARLLTESDIASSHCQNHWKSIVAGEVPFGFEVEVEDSK